ncbi:MAG: FAD-binding protein [Firmicutes bacterium]|nr:FAD-binding protein [Bacillota bacterium]
MLRRRFGGLLLAAFVLFSVPGCGFEPGLGEEQVLPLSADLIVIGDGVGGLTASLEAVRQGAAVLLFVEEPLAEGRFWEEGALHPKEAEAAGAGTLQEALAACGRGRGKGWHYELLSQNAAGALAWLSRETGLQMLPGEGFRYLPDNLFSVHPHRCLRETAVQEGVRLIAGVELKELLFGAGGEAAGVSFCDPAGQLNEAYAPAVILADGGFLGNPAKMAELAPEVTAASWREESRGGGLELARAAGLDLVDESLFSYALARETEAGWAPVEPPPETLLIIDGQIVPCSSYRESDLVELLRGTPPGSGYLLLPGDRVEEAPDWIRYSGIVSFLEDVQLDLPELRRRFRNPETVFWGCPVKPAAAYCLGGIAVEEAGRVLRDGKAVGGLYALGETAGGLNGEAVMPGAALTEALVWGRLLGAAAVDRLSDH